jgi:hypothetical protein
LALVRTTGRSTADFHEKWFTSPLGRSRRWPLLATAWTTVSAVEHNVLADWIIRLARISGQIVVEFHKS